MNLRPTLAALAASALPLTIVGGVAFAQSIDTGIRLATADWLERFDSSGGWIAAPAGVPAVKAVPTTADEAALEPGTYDIYWQQNGESDALLVAEDVIVIAGEVTTVRASTGVRLELADWVPRNPERSWFGALLPDAETFDFVSFTDTGDTMFLPPGQYDIFYTSDTAAEQPAIWLGTQIVEMPFGGIGAEVSVAEDESGLSVVRVLPGGPAESAGIEAGDTILAGDGESFAGLGLEEAVDLLRGPAESETVLTVARGKGDQLEITVTRSRVEPDRVIRANSGMVLDAPADALDPEGYWGAIFANEDPNGGLVNWSVGTVDEPLLLGPAVYDVYWSPEGDGELQLIASDVTVNGELVTVTPGPTK